MTDKEIADLYSLVREAFAGGNKSVQLEIFPFRMTAQNFARVAGNPNMAFWQNIKAGYDAFEATKRPPRWDVCDSKYVFNTTGAGGQPLDATGPCPVLKADATATSVAAAQGMIGAVPDLLPPATPSALPAVEPT